MNSNYDPRPCGVQDAEIDAKWGMAYDNMPRWFNLLKQVEYRLNYPLYRWHELITAYVPATLKAWGRKAVVWTFKPTQAFLDRLQDERDQAAIRAYDAYIARKEREFEESYDEEHEYTDPWDTGRSDFWERLESRDYYYDRYEQQDREYREYEN